jgi:hypothetical protein
MPQRGEVELNKTSIFISRSFEPVSKQVGCAAEIFAAAILCNVAVSARVEVYFNWMLALHLIVQVGKSASFLKKLPEYRAQTP